MLNRHYSFSSRIFQLEMAARIGDAECALRLLTIGDGVNPNQHTEDGSTPLYLAVKNKHVDVARILLAHGANPNFPCIDEETPLCAAINQIEMLDLLLSQQAIDVNQERGDGTFPLYLAAETGQVVAVKKLLAKKANATKTVNGITPKLAAIESKHANADLITAILPDESSLLKKLIMKLPEKIRPPLIPETCTHRRLIRHAERMGHTRIHNGICNGIAVMGMQALLLDERDEAGNLVNLIHFNNRWKRLDQVSEEKMSRNLEKIKNKCLDILKTHKPLISSLQVSELERELAGRGMNKKAKTANLTIKQKRQLLLDAVISEQLTDNENIDFEVPAFFDSLVLYQNSGKFPSVFESNKRPESQEINPVVPILMSQKLHEYNGINCVGRYSGIYTQEEMLDFFAELRKAFKRHLDFTHPVAMQLNVTNHAISVGYDPLKDVWWLINANRTECCKIVDDTDLVNFVSASFFSPGKTIAFSSQLYVANQFNAELKKLRIIVDWQNQPSWIKMHTITKEKAMLRDAQDESWEEVAYRTGQVDVVRELQKMDPFLHRHRKFFLFAAVFGLIILAALSVVVGVGSLGIVPALIFGGVFALEAMGGLSLICLVKDYQNRCIASKVAENNNLSMTNELAQQHHIEVDNVSTISIKKTLKKLTNKEPKSSILQVKPIDMKDIPAIHRESLFGNHSPKQADISGKQEMDKVSRVVSRGVS